jgi:hypothetical protein
MSSNPVMGAPKRGAEIIAGHQRRAEADRRGAK